jgi:hypothetical protein
VGAVSAATGLGLLDLAILDACDRLGAVSDRPHTKTQRVLDLVHARTGIGPRTAFEPLCDMARPWVSHLRLIDFHGNVGSPAGYGPASPRYTECRLTPLGSAALAAERGDLGPLPIGLINGDTHVGGRRPPLDPRRAIAAIRAATGGTDADVLAVLGGPEFPTGSRVEVDVAAWAAGSPAELRLSTRIAAEGEDGLRLTNFPPDRTSAEVAIEIQSLIDRANPFDPTARRASDDRPPAPIADINDDSIGLGAQLLLRLRRGTDPDEARRWVDDLWVLHQSITVHLGDPVVGLLRAAGAPDQPDLEHRLGVLEAAIRP